MTFKTYCLKCKMAVATNLHEDPMKNCPSVTVEDSDANFGKEYYKCKKV